MVGRTSRSATSDGKQRKMCNGFAAMLWKIVLNLQYCFNTVYNLHR